MKLTPRRRAYIYALCAAAVPLGVYLGWIDPKAAPLVIGFILALLNVPGDVPEIHNLDE